MEQFGLVREGTDWVLPHPKLLRGIVLLGEVLLLGLTQVGFAEGSWLLLLFCAVGAFLLLIGVRMRQTIDPQRRAFVWRGPFGHTVLPFQDIHALRLVHLTTNGA